MLYMTPSTAEPVYHLPAVHQNKARTYYVSPRILLLVPVVCSKVS